MWARLALAAIVLGGVGLTVPMVFACRSSFGGLSHSSTDVRDVTARDGSAEKQHRAVLVLSTDMLAGETLGQHNVTSKNVMLMSSADGVVLEVDRDGVVGKVMRFGGRRGDVLLWSNLRGGAGAPAD
jgi:flagella basal body P-ring formation protein FlgA